MKLNNLKNKISGFFASNAKANPMTHHSFPDLNDLYGDNNLKGELGQFSGYTSIDWVAIAVDTICKDAGNQPWFFEDKEKNTIDNNRIDERIISPINKGYYGQSFTKMMAGVIAQNVISGNSILYKDASMYSSSKQYKDMFVPMMPGQVKPIVSDNGLHLLGYELRFDDNNIKKVSPEDILHFSQSVGITSRFWGVGNVEKIRVTGQGEINASIYARDFWKNKIPPQLMITDPNPIDEPQQEALSQKLKQKYGKNAIRLQGEGIKADIISMSAEDIKFIESRDFTRDTILAIFGVVPDAVGLLDGSNRSTSVEQLLRYYKNINYILSGLEETINKQHVHLYNKEIFFRFEKLLTGDIDKIERMIKLGMITPSRGAEMLGEKQSKDTDMDKYREMFYLESTLVPMGFQSQDPTQAISNNTGTEKPSKGIDFYDIKNIDLICDNFIKSATKAKHFQVKYIRKSLLTRNAVERKYTGEISKFFESQKDSVISKLKELLTQKAEITLQSLLELFSKDDFINKLFRVEEENEKLKTIATNMHTSGVQRSVMDINIITGASVPVTISSPFIKNAIGRLSKQILEGGNVDGKNKYQKPINEITRQKLENILLKSIEQGGSIQELQSNIENTFDQFKGYRAVRIARTESRRAWDAGAELSYRSLGVEKVDVVNCTEFEDDYHCGRQGVLMSEVASLSFHPNHKGTLAPSLEVAL